MGLFCIRLFGVYDLANLDITVPVLGKYRHCNPFRVKATLMLLFIYMCSTQRIIFAQVDGGLPETITLNARVFDQETMVPAAYVAVFDQRTANGTLTNLNGFFRLKDLLPGDTIVFSCVGYEKVKMQAIELTNKEIIYIHPNTGLLNKVEVLADDSFLYKLVSGCRKTMSYEHRQAKTYFQLETYAGAKQIEMIECYYNGEYEGYDLNDLKLKDGRLALARLENNGLIVSLETSRAMNMHRMFRENEHFPVSPFELNKGKLRKNYLLHLASRYEDENAAIIYVIDYRPRDTSNHFFQGRVWIDSLSGNLRKVNLKVNNAKSYPFIVVGKNDVKLDLVDMEISKTFEEVGGKMYVKSIDFNYHLRYCRKDNGEEQEITTNAVLYAYNYDEFFVLPCFRFTEGMYSDYRKISAVPYNTAFWENIEEFRMADRINKNEKFFSENASLTNLNFFKKTSFYQPGFFERPYVFWSEKRIFIKEDRPKPPPQLIKGQGAPPPRAMYNLVVQIYMDVNEFDDSIYVQTETIFDPFQSYYYLPLTKESTAFVNMYFDLMEIWRRELEAEISATENKSVSAIQMLYQKKTKEIDQWQQEFFSEVLRGSARENMVKWNMVIVEKLGIDNIDFFSPYEAGQ